MPFKHGLYLVLLLWPLLQAPQPPRNLRLSTSPPPNKVSTYYVKKTGNDANDGLSEGTAKLTITAALGAISGSDTIIVHTGTYEELIHYGLIGIPSGSSGSPTTIMAATGETVTIKAPTGSADAYSVVGIFGPSYVTFKDFILDADNEVNGTVTVEYPSEHIRFEGNVIKNAIFNGLGVFASNNEFIGNDIHTNGFSATFGAGGSWGYGVYLSGAGNLFERNDVHFNSRYGFHLYSQVGSVNNNIIRKNRVFENGQEANGAEILVGGAGNRIYNNLIFNGNRVGIGGSIGVPIVQHAIQVDYSGPDSNAIYNNTCYNMPGYGVILGTDSSVVDTVIKNNIFRTMDLGDVFNAGGASGTVTSNNPTSDPSFVNAGSEDFHLQSGSAAIGAGVAIPGITTDFDGATRANPPAVGAYEPTSVEEGGGGDVGDTQITTLGVYGGPVPVGTFIGSDTLIARDVFERADRASVQLIGVLSPTVREVAERTDRASVSIIGTVNVTAREVVTRTDRASVSLLETFEVSTRDTRVSTDRATTGLQVPFSDQMVILTHIHGYFQDDSFGFSSLHVNGLHDHPGKVILWGGSEREIPIPPTGPPRISDMVVEYDDTDQYFRKTFGARTPKYRKVDFRIGPAGGVEALFQTPATGVITDVKFPPGRMRLYISDFRDKWLQREMPSLVDIDTFPNMPTSSRGAFAQIIFGIVSSEGFGGQGAIRLIHVDTLSHRYLVARHPIESVVLWRKAIDQHEYSVVDESEYTLLDPIPMIINGVEWEMSFVEFGSDQNGADISADVHGNNLYGDWGIFHSHNTVSRNAIDHAFTLTYFMERVEQVITNYHVDSWAVVRQQLEDRGWYADWAITETTTTEAALTHLFGERHVHWFPNRRDQFYVKMTPEDIPADAPRFGDALHILRESEMIELAQETRNRIIYKFAETAEGTFAGEGVYNNVADQAALLDENGDPIIEEETLHLKTVRVALVGLEVATEWGVWRDHDAHRVRFELDMPTNIVQDRVELANDSLVTHYGGLVDGGWIGERFIPYRIRDDYDRLRFVVDAIRRPAVPGIVDQIAEIGRWSWNHLPGPWYVAATKLVFEVFVDDRVGSNKMVMLVTGDDGLQEPVDDGVFPAIGIIESSEAKRYGNKVYVATQERGSGRVAGHIFDLAAREWTTLNRQFIASNSHADCGVSVVVRQPSGQFGIMYQGDRGTGTGTMGSAGPGQYMRAKFKFIDDDDNLSAEFNLGNPDTMYAQDWFVAWGDPSYLGKVHMRVGRVIAEENDSVRFMLSGDEPADAASTADMYTQLLSGLNILSPSFEHKMTFAGELVPRFAYGDPCTFTYNGIFHTAVPISIQNSPRLKIWQSTSTAGQATYDIPLGATLLAETSPDTFETLSSPIGVRPDPAVPGRLIVILGTRAAGQQDWAAYKTVDPPYTTAVPINTSRQSQIGPTWAQNTYARQGFDVATIRGKLNVFKVTSGNEGLPGLSGYRISEHIIVPDEVPGDNSFSVEDFILLNS